MRRTDREMNKKFAIDIVDKSKFAVVAAVLPSGAPYCVPMSLARVGYSLYFHCAVEGQKIDAFEHCAQVCVTFVDGVMPAEDQFTTAYESAIVNGKAVRIEDDAEKIAALRAICMRYTPSNMDNFETAIVRSLNRTDVWRIDIVSISGKCKRLN